MSEEWRNDPRFSDEKSKKKILDPRKQALKIWDKISELDKDKYFTFEQFYKSNDWENFKSLKVKEKLKKKIVPKNKLPKKTRFNPKKINKIQEQEIIIAKQEEKIRIQEEKIQEQKNLNLRKKQEEKLKLQEEQLKTQEMKLRAQEEQLKNQVRRQENNLNSNDRVWAHCRNYQCNDYTQLYRIYRSNLNTDRCNICDSMYMDAEMVNGRPIIPTNGKPGSTKTNYSSFKRSEIKKNYGTYDSPEYRDGKSEVDNGHDTFTKFEKGTLDLATAFWGFGFFGSILVGIVFGVLSEMVHGFFNIPYIIFTAAIIGSLWGCAENYNKMMTQNKQSTVWGVLTQGYCILGGLGLAGHVFQLIKDL
ncbi:hypothetical protein N9365_05245 [Candidatus Pelagibacter sp.]|jgi:hypothetical protein|nr:hypothetical protein [Candidatus Pelagibacter sp.]